MSLRFLSRRRRVPTVSQLRNQLRRQLGYPAHVTGTSSFHLAWLLAQGGHASTLIASRKHLSEVWNDVSLVGAGEGRRFVGDARPTAWARSAVAAASYLAAAGRLLIGEPRLEPLLRPTHASQLLLRLESAQFFADRSDRSAHFVVLVPSAAGRVVIDGYGGDTIGRAMAFDWAAWSDDVIVTAPRTAGVRPLLRKKLKAYPVFSIETRGQKGNSH